MDSKSVFDAAKQIFLALRSPDHLRVALGYMLGLRPAVLLFLFPSTVGYFVATNTASTGYYFFALCFAFIISAFCLGFALLLYLGTRPSAFPKHIVELLNDNASEGENDLCTENAAKQFHRDLSSEEMNLLSFIESITVGYVDQKSLRNSGVWGMTGGKKGDANLGFTSRRYHLAFSGYAAAIACAKTPAYVGRVKRILSAIISHILEEEVWREVNDYYWPNSDNPFQCKENIMWTGHVLELCMLYEAQTGCCRYRDPGGLVAVRTRSSTGEKVHVTYRSSVSDLAKCVANSMRENPTGGVPCEPGLVFFQCNNHPQIALRLLELLARDGDEDKDVSYARERFRWEDNALRTMCATTGSGTATGAFRILWRAEQGEKQGVAASPIGHLGSDGWNLTHYFAWARSRSIPERIWHDVTRPILDSFACFDQPPSGWTCTKTVCDDEPHPLPANSSGGSSAPNACCFNLNIPVSAWACSLLPVCAQARDHQTYHTIYSWLKKHYMRRSSSARPRAWLEESVEWMVGNTAQFLMAVSLRADPGLYRRLVQHPLPRKFFREGPLLEGARWLDRNHAPTEAGVLRCWYGDVEAVGRSIRPSTQNVGQKRLHMKVMCQGGGLDLVLRLRNVTRVHRVRQGAGEDGENIPFTRDNGELSLSNVGRPCGETFAFYVITTIE